MRRFSALLVVCLCALPLLAGCKSWGWGKKEAAADPYASQPMDTAATQPGYDPYAPYTPTSTPTYAAPTTGSRTHTVAKGDTLFSIARMYYNGDMSKWRAIYDANRDSIGSDPNKIRVGQKLAIP